MRYITGQGLMGLMTASIMAAMVFPVLAADPEKVSQEAAIEQKGVLPLDDLRTFVRVYEQVRQAYVEDVTDQAMLENAIRGMLGELDPHSAYLDEKDLTDLTNATSGEFGGLGIEVGMEDGFVKVISPIDDTPASRAGIEAGDVIIKLDDASVKGMGLDEAINQMRGKPGEALALTILRKGAEQPMVIRVVRDIIKVKSVRYAVLEPGYGYVRLAQFQQNTGEDLKRALDALRSQDANKGLVLDLRNNPGGLLDAAVSVSDIFLDSGLIVYTKGRVPDANMRNSATPGDQTGGAPIVVLINDGSASASEIVAGALQDHHRAVVMGTNSFGKGSVQSIIPIGESKAIKLTTALYYTPNGRSIQAEGIKPDIVVERAKLTAVKDTFKSSEAGLARHLRNGQDDAAGSANSNKAEKKAKSKKNGAADEIKEILQDSDNQVHDALNVLKAMTFTRQSGVGK
jgi:carboxyl-terminal processing protease